MSEVHRVSVDIGGTEITFETGRLAKQASGSVVVSSGETMVLGTDEETWDVCPDPVRDMPEAG